MLFYFLQHKFEKEGGCESHVRNCPPWWSTLPITICFFNNQPFGKKRKEQDSTNCIILQKKKKKKKVLLFFLSDHLGNTNVITVTTT